MDKMRYPQGGPSGALLGKGAAAPVRGGLACASGWYRISKERIPARRDATVRVVLLYTYVQYKSSGVCEPLWKIFLSAQHYTGMVVRAARRAAVSCKSPKIVLTGSVEISSC